MFKNKETPSKAKVSKKEIFQKSITVFSEMGIDNVTMRDLARACNLSPGAFYYHFKNKDDLILHYYKESLAGHLERGEKYIATAPKNLGKVMKWICHDRFHEFSEHKSMLKPFATKMDLNSPTSLMADESFEIRQKSVDFFSNIASHTLSTKDPVSDIIGRFLWLHHLLIISFWLRGDDINNKGIRLLEESNKVWKWLPTFLKIPGSNKLLLKIVSSLKRIGIWEEYNE